MCRELLELVGCEAERRMGLCRRRERLVDADVKLTASAECEPGAAARAERLRLLELLEAEQVAEETPRLGLAAGRGRELDVI